MEEWFGISYPTVKNRLNRLATFLEFAEAEDNLSQDPNQILQRLSRGDVSVAEAKLALTPVSGDSNAQ